MPDGEAATAGQASSSNTPEGHASNASSLPPLAQAPPVTLSADQLRELVLDYLSHGTFIDSAISFVRAWERPGQRDGSDEPVASTSATSLDSHSHRAENGGTVADAEDSDDDTMMQSVHETFPVKHSDSTASSGGPVRHSNDGGTRHGFEHLSDQAINQIRARREISRLIRQGAIQAAIDLCSSQFPDVLSDFEGPNSSEAHQSSSAQSHSSRKPNKAALNPSSLLGFFGKTSPRPGGTASPVERFTNNLTSPNVPAWPSLLLLSLQIQLFIEMVRASAPPPGSASNGGATGSNPSRPSTPFSNAHSPGSANGSMEESTNSLASTTSHGSHASSMLSNGSAGSTSAISQALSQAQSLHAQASRISDSATRSAYLKELEAVSGLLPYRDPGSSPMAFYLDEQRRDRLADAVNGAIMLSLGQPSTNSKLENLVRQNVLMWLKLQEDKCIYPPERGSNKNAPPKLISAFDMQTFLDTQWSEA